MPFILWACIMKTQQIPHSYFEIALQNFKGLRYRKIEDDQPVVMNPTSPVQSPQPSVASPPDSVAASALRNSSGIQSPFIAPSPNATWIVPVKPPEASSIPPVGSPAPQFTTKAVVECRLQGTEDLVPMFQRQ